MRNGGGMRSDMGGMRGGNHAGGMKRRWDSAGGSGDQGLQNKRPYPSSSHSFASNGLGGSSNSYQPKPYRPYDQNKPAMASAPSYPKFPSFTPMTMPPSLSAYPGIASAVANFTFPPPSSHAMPPLPKN
jgi:hypothetical protein